MIYRHINRGDIKEGGCPMCKPRISRNSNWYKGYFDETHSSAYAHEEAADYPDPDPQPVPADWGERLSKLKAKEDPDFVMWYD